MLADEVDRRGRIARAREEAGRAAHDLDPLVDRHVGARLAIGAGQRPGRRHAVDLRIADFEAARIEAVAHAIEFVDRHADAVLDHRTAEHTYELHALMRNAYAVF